MLCVAAIAVLCVRAMDVSRGFFGKLRSLALTLEKEVKHLERAMNGEDADYEEESPMRVLQDLHSEIRTVKEDASAVLAKSSSEKKEVNDFLKATEILMQRSAEDLAKIREVFEKYGYKPQVEVPTEEQEEEANGDSKTSDQSKSDQEQADDVPPLPACAENPAEPRDPLWNPQLSDFGLSHYAFSRPRRALHGQQHAANASQENAEHKTPPKTQAPCALPKTPKCMLKMDDFECVTPKLEHFGISEHTMCMNEDYTMTLICKTAQSNNSVKTGDREVNVAKMPPMETAVTPEPKTKATDENVPAADYMASPVMPVFCTPCFAPGVKIPSRADSAVSARSPERDKLPLPSHAATPPPPDFEARWLKGGVLEMQEKKITLVTENNATEKQSIEGSIPSAVSSDAYLQHLGNQSPPKIKQYDHLLSTPPPPEITRIPDDVLQILSKYNHKVDSSVSKKVETKAGDAARFGSDFSAYCSKENRGYPGVFKPDI